MPIAHSTTVITNSIAQPLAWLRSFVVMVTIQEKTQLFLLLFYMTKKWCKSCVNHLKMPAEAILGSFLNDNIHCTWQTHYICFLVCYRHIWISVTWKCVSLHACMCVPVCACDKPNGNPLTGKKKIPKFINQNNNRLKIILDHNCFNFFSAISSSLSWLLHCIIGQ